MKWSYYPALILLLLLGLSACEGFDEYINETETNVWQTFDSSNGLKENNTWCVFPDSKGNIWIGMNSYGVMKYDGREWKNYSTAHGLINNTVLSITEDGTGDIWIGTFQGFSIFNGSSFSNYNGMNSDIWTVRDLFYAENGDIWIGTMGHGLFQATSNGIYSVHSETNPGLNSVNSISQDEEGIIWAGTDGGVYKIDGQNYEILSTSDGFESNLVKAVCCDTWGDVWMGSWEAEYISRYQDGNLKLLSVFNGAEYAYCNAITEDENGNIWFGLINDGAAKYDGASVKTYNKDDGLAGKTVLDIAVDSKGNIWFASLEDGVSVYTPATE